MLDPHIIDWLRREEQRRRERARDEQPRLELDLPFEGPDAPHGGQDPRDDEEVGGGVVVIAL